MTETTHVLCKGWEIETNKDFLSFVFDTDCIVPRWQS